MVELVRRRVAAAPRAAVGLGATRRGVALALPAERKRGHGDVLTIGPQHPRGAAGRGRNMTGTTEISRSSRPSPICETHATAPRCGPRTASLASDAAPVPSLGWFRHKPSVINCPTKTVVLKSCRGLEPEEVPPPPEHTFPASGRPPWR